MFCGLLPWTWFASSLMESSGVLISGGNLIKKVLFPAEILPIVTVTANMVHFFLALPILGVLPDRFSAPLTVSELACFPLVVAVQLLFTLGCALILSALTVHFRDIRDILSNILTLWFFATPIIYPYQYAPDPGTAVHESEPVRPSGDLLSGNPVLPRPVRTLEVAGRSWRGFNRVVSARLLDLRPLA